VRERKNCEDERENHGGGLRADNHAMAIPTVGRHAAYWREQEYGYLSGEADYAEKQRGARKAINQPGLRDILHPGADERDELSAEEKLEVAMAKRAHHVTSARTIFRSCGE